MYKVFDVSFLHTYLLMMMQLPECSETSAYIIQMLGVTQKRACNKK